ncbi:hypothetical protein [Nocardia wallacei]|uniref:hypothetical protein n=1 Tax=Nocardia wallacei TaxID=480035 RepID=UPI0024557F6C|nr:hypothetical protein [Nocardia wallacei]
MIDRWRRDSGLVFWESYVDTDIPMDAVTADAAQFGSVAGTDVVQRFFEVAQKILTDGEWRVAFLAWAMDRTDHEIADALGTTAKTVRTHKWSARKKIRACTRHADGEITFDDDLAAKPVQRDNPGNQTTPGIGEVTV